VYVFLRSSLCSLILLFFYLLWLEFSVVDLAEDEDIVRSSPPDAGQDEEDEEGGVEEAEVEEEGGGEQPHRSVDQLDHQEDGLGLGLVWVPGLAWGQDSQPVGGRDTQG